MPYAKACLAQSSPTQHSVIRPRTRTPRHRSGHFLTEVTRLKSPSAAVYLVNRPSSGGLVHAGVTCRRKISLSHCSFANALSCPDYRPPITPNHDLITASARTRRSHVMNTLWPICSEADGSRHIPYHEPFLASPPLPTLHNSKNSSLHSSHRLISPASKSDSASAVNSLTRSSYLHLPTSHSSPHVYTFHTITVLTYLNQT